MDPFTTGGATGNWSVTWRITNAGDRGIRLLSAQHPHSQFRTSDMALEVAIAAGASADLTLPVRFNELPGVVVENPFLLVRLRDGDEWRVLARVRVTAGTRGEPLAGRSVVVTTQRVGGAAAV